MTLNTFGNFLLENSPRQSIFMTSKTGAHEKNSNPPPARKILDTPLPTRKLATVLCPFTLARAFRASLDAPNSNSHLAHYFHLHIIAALFRQLTLAS